MKSLILENSPDIPNRIKIFVPFNLLQELLERGFPNEMVQAIDQNLLKDGTHILESNDEVRITIDTNNLKGTSGIATLQSISFIEISDKIVTRTEDILKIDTLAKDLEKIFPHIDFSVVSTWAIDLQKKEVVEDMKGAYLEKDKWHITEPNKKLLQKIEGTPRKKPFWDRERWAIGYGHSLKSQFELGEEISDQKIEELFLQDLKEAETAVKGKITVPLTLDMYAALTSFAYNAGIGGFRKSQTAELINQKRYKEAAETMKSEKILLGTKYEKGLRRRRERESTLFMGNTDKNIA